MRFSFGVLFYLYYIKERFLSVIETRRIHSITTGYINEYSFLSSPSLLYMILLKNEADTSKNIRNNLL
jgi:hypothetical protein